MNDSNTYLTACAINEVAIMKRVIGCSNSFFSLD